MVRNGMRRFIQAIKRAWKDHWITVREVFPDYHPAKPSSRELISRRAALIRMLKAPAVRTAIETPIVRIGAKMAHAMVNENLIGDERYRDATRRSVMSSLGKSAGRKAMTVFLSTVFAPGEEMLYRIIPNEVLERQFPQLRGKNVWKAGIPISVIFAGMHNLNLPPGYRNRVIPVKQFLMGCYYWYLVRQRGRRHAAGAHAESNFIETMRAFWLQ